MVAIELGIEAADDADLFYFRFGDDVVKFPIEEGRDLLRLFQVLAAELEDIRRESRSSLEIAPPPSPGRRWETWRPQLWRPDAYWPGW
jgi:hypothetical protein